MSARIANFSAWSSGTSVWIVCTSRRGSALPSAARRTPIAATTLSRAGADSAQITSGVRYALKISSAFSDQWSAPVR